MKTIFAVLAAAMVASTGCVTLSVPGAGEAHILMLQPGIEVSVFNQCTNEPGFVYARGYRGPIPVYPGRPTVIPVSRAAFEGNTYNLNLVYQVRQGEHIVLGSIAHSFQIQDQSAVTRYTWIIGGNSSAGGWNIYYDHLQGVC